MVNGLFSMIELHELSSREKGTTDYILIGNLPLKECLKYLNENVKYEDLKLAIPVYSYLKNFFKNFGCYYPIFHLEGYRDKTSYNIKSLKLAKEKEDEQKRNGLYSPIEVS